jgi:hypothetical protein
VLKSGVLQGDTLAPYLFILLLNLLLEEAMTPDASFPLSAPTAAITRQHAHSYNFRPRPAPRAVCLQELAFADDIAIPAESPASAARILRRLQKLAEEVGLELNVASGKTEIQVLRGSTGCPLPGPAAPNNDPAIDEVAESPLQDLHGTKITVCADYKYLGSHPTNIRKALAARISLAWFAIRRLKPVWSSVKCPLHKKTDLLRALVTSVLLYCSEIWTSAIATIADRAYHSMLKYATRSFSEPIVDLIARCRLPHVSSIAAERQINLIGHALRMVCPLTYVLNHTLPLNRSAPLHKLLQSRIKQPRPEWGTYATHRKEWHDLAKRVAYDREEAVQLALLRARRRRWLNHKRLENRIYLMILEASTDLLHKEELPLPQQRQLPADDEEIRVRLHLIEALSLCRCCCEYELKLPIIDDCACCRDPENGCRCLYQHSPAVRRKHLLPLARPHEPRVLKPYAMHQHQNVFAPSSNLRRLQQSQ